MTYSFNNYINKLIIYAVSQLNISEASYKVELKEIKRKMEK